MNDSFKGLQFLDDFFWPQVFSSGDIVGPGEDAYVLPCTTKCCQSTPACALNKAGC